MTKAGFYNTLLKGDDPLVMGRLNGYRLKEKLPKNLETLLHPLVLQKIKRQRYHSVFLWVYFAFGRRGHRDLAQVGIEVEIIDAVSLPLTVHILP